MLTFRRAFKVRAPLERVADFHWRAESLRAITPSLIPMRLGDVPERLLPGCEFGFRMWLGLLPLRWRARIEEAEDGFVDSQVEGPFRSWRHRHRFVAIDPETTEVRDEIEAELASHPFWWLVGLKMWIGLPLLFAYRALRTRQLLEE